MVSITWFRSAFSILLLSIAMQAQTVVCTLHKKVFHTNQIYVCRDNSQIAVWVAAFDKTGYMSVTSVFPNVGLVAYVPIVFTDTEQDFYDLAHTGQFVAVWLTKDSQGKLWVKMRGKFRP